MQLADTNVISELMRQQPDAGVMAWAEHAAADEGRIAISVISVFEIAYGLNRRPHPAKFAWFDRFIHSNSILDATEVIARRAGEMKALLSLRGQVRSQPDMFIAATAQAHGLTLVTRNVRDFDGCGIAVLDPFTT